MCIQSLNTSTWSCVDCSVFCLPFILYLIYGKLPGNNGGELCATQKIIQTTAAVTGNQTCLVFSVLTEMQTDSESEGALITTR